MKPPKNFRKIKTKHCCYNCGFASFDGYFECSRDVNNIVDFDPADIDAQISHVCDGWKQIKAGR
jgi:hypothetical protein